MEKAIKRKPPEFPMLGATLASAITKSMPPTKWMFFISIVVYNMTWFDELIN